MQGRALTEKELGELLACIGSTDRRPIPLCQEQTPQCRVGDSKFDRDHLPVEAGAFVVTNV
jgi:hypothetical protein